MFLSDNEKRDIAKFIEAGKPLPDKYRFLLFEDKREVELVWNGKTNEVTNVVLPFQTIEQVDEPRSEKEIKMQRSLFDVDSRGRQLKGWTNKLIWGDNKLILSSLKNGPMRQEIEAQGGVKLIYIDPPFDVGADFSMNIEIGNEEFTKKPNVLEELAYRDTWGKGADSFIAMIYERISLMRDLLAADGSIYIHCDYRVDSFIRMILDEIFGHQSFRNHIIWCYSGGGIPHGELPKKHDDIFWYTKSESSWNYKPVYRPYSEGTQQRGRTAIKGVDAKLRDEGTPINDWWTDVKKITSPTDYENLDYPTQKSEDLLSRIINLSSNENDIVADFFCGSGTTLAAAEKLGRKWIGSDLGKFAIHTTRKRMVGVQRQLKKNGKNYRAFEILNLGKYERQHYIGVNPNLRDEEKQAQIAQREKDFIALVLGAYKAEAFSGFKTFHGKKSSRLVAIGPINLPVSRLFVEEVINECQEKRITKADILAFEFEMGLFPNIQEEAKSKGIDLALKYIPRDVFDKRAIEKNQVVFHDVSYIEVKPIIKKNTLAIEITDFSVFYNQDSIKEVEENLKNGGKKLVVENGQIIKISKDKDGIIEKENLTKEWTDWIDYWAVDFDFESKKEIIRVSKKESVQPKLDGSADPHQVKLPEFEEVWTGDYVFENEWQSFRTKKDRSLELISVAKEMPAGKHKVAVKVVDIFGNDTMKIIEIKI
jgi:DNA modification methylase